MALSIAPSEYWEGNDGPWSTFNVNVGTPQQQMRVLPATSGTTVIVVYDPQGCPSNYPSACSTLRGQLFNPDVKDATWRPAQQSLPFFHLPFEPEEALANYTDINGYVGFDTLRLDWNGTDAPSHGEGLNQQTIAAIAAPNPWLGLLGISGRPSHIFNASSSQDSPLQSLVNSDYIKTLYWAYTAGAPYAEPPVTGSLTFGGYDAARVNMSAALTVPMNTQDTTRDLQVAVRSITISGGLGSGPTLGLPIYATIDSVVPELWLPEKVCESFENDLGLVWNETYDMYLINDTQHQNLLATNPTVNIFLSAQSDDQNQVPITLPYAAFDLTATFPLAGIQDGNMSYHYFPLKKAANQSQYFLGRTILQEAYVTADYNTSQFTVGQTIHATTKDIKAVGPTGQDDLSGGSIAGIAIGAAVAALALASALLWWFWWRPRRIRTKHLREKHDTVYSDGMRAASLDTTTIVGDSEMTGQERVEEYFNKAPLTAEDVPPGMKLELDANETARGKPPERHELDAGSLRPSPYTHLSWETGHSGVSPVVRDPAGVPSLMGHPSPPLDERFGSPSPPLSERVHGRTISEASVPQLSPRSHGRAFSDGSVPGVYEIG